MRVRREKLDRLRASGVDPYPVGYPRTATSPGSCAPSTPTSRPDIATGERVGVAGPRDALADRRQALLRDAARRHGRDPGDAVPGPARRGVAGVLEGERRPRRPRRRHRRGDHLAARRALGARRELGADREVPASAARQAQGSHRPRGARPPALRRPHREPGGAPDAPGAQRRGALAALDADGRRLRRGRDPDAAGRARRRERAPVHHAHQRLRRRPVPAHRAGAVPQAARGRRDREGLRDQPELPQRGRRLHAQPGVHDARGVRGLRRLRHDGHAHPPPRSSRRRSRRSDRRSCGTATKNSTSAGNGGRSP